jgi:hypothetical protein
LPGSLPDLDLGLLKRDFNAAQSQIKTLKVANEGLREANEVRKLTDEQKGE